MEKLLKHYHRPLLLLLVFIMITSFKRNESAIIYKKQFTDDEKISLSESILNGAGTDLYYQGTVSERQIIKEAGKLDPENADVFREMGVPYLKRGFAAEANHWYTLAAEGDPLNWLGYKAYCWLYFYRDYQTALDEFNLLDPMTPDFVDYPQATSIDFMRGICYLGLDQHDNAIAMFEKHILNEKDEVGAEYIGAMPYQLLGIAYHKNGQFKNANSTYEEGIKYNKDIADLWFYHAVNLFHMNKKSESKMALNNAQDWYDKDSKNQRAYVEEFYAIYQEDIDSLVAKLNK